MAQPLRFRQVRFAPPIALLALPQRLFRLAPVVNVDADAHPANDPPVGVADRQATTKVPTVLPVRSPAHGRLVAPLGARCEGLPEEFPALIPVFGVYGLHPIEPFALCRREPRVVVPPLVPEDV